MNLSNITIPTVVKGGLSVDDRGTLTFNNDLNLEGVKRYYTIENHSRDFSRGWHGSKTNKKIFVPIVGSFIVAWREMILKDGKVDLQAVPKDYGRAVLSAANPQALVLPGGYLNGSMALTEGAVILVLNTLTIAEAVQDDYRAELYDDDDWSIEANWWPFSVEER